MGERLLIVGAGMAAAYLLQELAAHEHNFAITVVGDEPQACYNRVLLAHLLAAENNETDLAMLPLDRTLRTTTFLTGTRISGLDLLRKEARTSTGETLSFDRLVLATGALTAMPPLRGIHAAGISVFRSIADARHLQQASAGKPRVTVVGAGLLGLEAAHGLNSLGCEVTVLHRNQRIMNRQLDKCGAAQLQADLESRGMQFELGASIASLTVEDNRLRGFELAGGVCRQTDLLVFATGIQPAAGLARAAGLDCDRGIRVDGRLQTSLPGVYALGECCQLGEQCFGLVAPIREQASVLCRELLAIEGPAFNAGQYPTQLKISGVDIYSAGQVDRANDEENLVFHDPAHGVYRRLVMRGSRLTGAVLVGDKRGGVWYGELISEATDVSSIRPGLMFGREVSAAMQSARAAA